jgi:hypothetical protein
MSRFHVGAPVHVKGLGPKIRARVLFPETTHIPLGVEPRLGPPAEGLDPAQDPTLRQKVLSNQQVVAASSTFKPRTRR